MENSTFIHIPSNANTPLSPSQRRGAPFRALFRDEGIKSTKLFTPEKGKHWRSRKIINDRGREWPTVGGYSYWSQKYGCLSGVWISNISIFKSIYIYIWKITFHTTPLKKFLFEEMRRIDLLWEIVKYTVSLLRMFIVYEFCCFNLLRKTCTAFLFNEAVLKFAKLPCLI
jgi:hypothetical protein